MPGITAYGLWTLRSPSLPTDHCEWTAPHRVAGQGRTWPPLAEVRDLGTGLPDPPPLGEVIA